MEDFLAKLIQKKLLVLAFFFVITASGITALLNLPIDAFPDLANNQVQIMSESPGLGPVEVEELVTIPLESVMSGLPGVSETRSISKYGISVVSVIFKDQVDTYFARQLVLERLQSARSRLPSQVNPQLGPISTAMGEIYQYIVSGKGYSATTLKTLQDWDLKYQLRTVAGVAEVNTWGGLTDEYEVELSPITLQQYGLTLADVFQAIQKNNANFGAGIINHEQEQYIIRGLGRVEDLAAIENITVKSVQNVPILLKNIARVYHGSALRQGAATADGKGEAVLGLVMMLKGENSRAVIERVKHKVNELQKSLPKGVSIQAFYDQSALTEQTIETVKENLLIGGSLVLIVLLLTVDSLTAATICASAIPFSMMFSFIGMRLMGVTANIMSLGAVDFGMIVDGAIVMIENAMRHLAENFNPANYSDKATANLARQQIIDNAAREVFRPILFGVAIITTVYMPILGLEGMEYKLFSPMVVTVSSALLGSLFVSLLLVPVLAKLIIHKPPKHKDNPLISFLYKPFDFLFHKAMHHGPITLICAVLAFISTIALVPFLGTEFVPRLDEGDILLEVKNIPSISLPHANEVSGNIERIVKESPEVKAVVSRTGRPDLATDPMGVFGTDCFIMLKDKHEWRPGLTKDKLVQELRARVSNGIAGSQFNFTQPIAMRVDELVSGVRADIAVKIFGDNMEYLQDKAKEVEAILATIKGATDLQIEKTTGSEQLLIIPNRVRMSRYGVSIEDIRTVAETAIMGTAVSQVLEGKKRFDLRVRFPYGINMEPDDLGSLLVENQTGKRIPLSQVAEIVRKSGLETVNREQGQRRIVVQCNVRGRDIGSFVKECQKAIAAKLDLKAGTYITFGGQFENQERAMAKLSILVPLSILIIFILLTMAFNSLAKALLVLLNVPFALVGGILALYIRGLYLSVPAAIGFIALFGVAVLNGVVLISYIKRLREDGVPLMKAIHDGVRARFRPVIMTAMVAALGFMPMAFSTGSGAEVQKPLATVVIGGLISSTLLTLLVLPVVYSFVAKYFNKSSHKDEKLSATPEDSCFGHS
jgi:cobalt-zinc-cadmium resistance protein CzcA